MMKAMRISTGLFVGSSENLAELRKAITRSKRRMGIPNRRR